MTNAPSACQVLVNEAHPLPLDWVPDDLVDLRKAQPRHYLLPSRQTRLAAPAADAANALFELAERGWTLEEWHAARNGTGPG